MNSTHLKRLSAISVFSALSVALVAIIHFPIFPAAPYLEYDPADVFIVLCSFLFGPWAGIMMTVIVSVLQGTTVSAQSGVYGIVMHIIATGTYALTAGTIFKLARKHKPKSHSISTRDFVFALFAVILGSIAMTLIMVPANLIVTPLFTGFSTQTIKGLLLPIIVPFNLIKAVINGTIALLLFKPMFSFANKFGFYNFDQKSS